MAYVTFDPENGDLNLALPPAYIAFHDELCLELSETFTGALDDALLAEMNRFVEDWIGRKNIRS
ncbi:MAG: hypothetical protein HGA76_03010 [Candidatus Firestonebacteria bacterium]|nr:hypothetical protein [Candidatus Firestonebacteria bacterium]